MYKILDGVNSPQDIKNMDYKELKELSRDIRKFIVKNVSTTGGHLASNLGVVEITLALHKVFDSPKDKIIWDVGHQSYVHKLLTGRKKDFDTLRKYNGMSGFPKESESEHDIFDTGHSSTSISAGLGIACARDIKKESFNVISVIGDGAITGGMAVEALNNLGYMKKNMIVLFNDNEMSIDKNTGAFSTYMSKFIVNSETLNLKNKIDKLMNMTYVGGKISEKANRLTDSIITSILPSECSFMDGLGIRYIGPIDGHNIETLIEILEYAKHIDGPKFIHVKTVKGKGYMYSEDRPDAYHGVGAFDYREGVGVSSKKSISQVVGETLKNIADNDEKIVAVTAAMPTGTGLNIYERFHPDRYFDVGICEQHAVTFCAGLAKQGLKPYFAVYSTFLQRGYDQLIHDVCINSRPVTFLIDRAGLVGNDGETHHGQFDLSYLSPIPNITVMAPSDTDEMKKMIEFSSGFQTTLAIRYPRGSEYYLDVAEFNFIKEGIKSPKLSEIGRGRIIHDGLSDSTEKVAIFTIGNMLIPTLKALETVLQSNNGRSYIVVDSRYLKPLDKDFYKEILEKVDKVITIEDNVITGGYGSQVESIVDDLCLDLNVEKIGIPDKFITHGDIGDLMDEVMLSPTKLAKRF